MCALKLTNPTADELRHAFAMEVAKYTLSQYGEYFTEAGLFVGSRSTLPPWDTSIDAVLPWLDKEPEGWRATRGEADGRGDYNLVIYGAGPRTTHAQGMGLARTATIALLRTHGVEVEFTT